MKQKVAKPSDSGMRFFTPELYIAFNSPNDDEADHANSMWEHRIEEYRHHLDSFRKNMPQGLQFLSDLSFHDVEILTLQDAELLGSKPSAQSTFLLTLRSDQKTIVLTYFLWDRVRQLSPSPDWHFSTSHLHWLYDEFDAVNGHNDLFWHRILMSNGAVIEIPTSDVCPITYSPAVEAAA